MKKENNRKHHNIIKQLFCALSVLVLLSPILWVLPVEATEITDNTIDQSTCSHEYEVQLVRQATDDEDGERIYTCVKCGYSYTEVIPAIGHAWGALQTGQESTCQTHGYRYRVCQHDSTHVQREELPLTEHNYQVTVTEPKLGVEGSRVYTCSICGDTYTETIPALPIEEVPKEVESENNMPEVEPQEAEPSVQTPTVEKEEGGINVMDIVLSTLTFGSFAGFAITIGSDLRLVRWNQKRKKMRKKDWYHDN